MNISEQTLALLRSALLRKDNTTAGISTSTALNFYYLEPQAKNIYPVFYPLLASTPRVNPMFGGMKVGGPAVNWKAIIQIDSGGYPGVSEGNRNAFMNIKERDFSATYKFLGKDTEVSFQAQQTGLGFDDNIALAQLALLNALLNDEERMILYGNSGSGGNGYQLGTTNTPVLTAIAGGSIPGTTTIAVYAIALTPWGTQLATATGCALPITRANADSSTDVINGGTAAISAASNQLTISSPNQQVKVVIPATTGAVGYAIYVTTGTVATSAAKFAGISPYPGAVINDGTSGTLPYLGVASAQLANASNSTGNFTTDNSANALDFDGCLTWGFNYASNSFPSYVKDMAGGGFTSNGDGTIAEFEDALDFAWKNYKITYDKIYVGGTLIDSVSRAILTGSSGPGAQRMFFENDSAGRLVGGTKIVQYRSKYSNSGAAKVLDVMTHPWLPDGVVYFDLVNNPYPAAGNSIPSVRRIVSLEDHFSIRWPYRKLQHELGVYCFETMEHYIPFGVAVLTGFANKVN